MQKGNTSFLYLAVGMLLLATTACRKTREDEKPVHGYLSGVITVADSIDASTDYAGFEVLVVDNTSGDVDTLGIAYTDSTGAFSLDLHAPYRGIFPLLISRNGTMLLTDELAVADGDSGSVRLRFPQRHKLILVRGSVENGAWRAYRNAKELHTRTLASLLQPDVYDQEKISMAIRQTANLMWGLEKPYPGTIGARVAAAESILMLDGWDDALLVERARSLPLDKASLIEVARAARRAQARLAGQEAALALVYGFLGNAKDPELRAGLKSEIILAHMDSLERDAALEAAHKLAREAPSEQWVKWADRAIYELDNLMPGMPAPGFIAEDVGGLPVTLDSLRGQIVVLEFYAPTNQLFLQDLALRNQLFETVAPLPVKVVSISVHPDPAINEAFLEGRNIPGIHIFAEGGRDGALARLYNVNVLPTRYVIDPAGKIFSKYFGNALVPVQRDILLLLQAMRR